MSDKYVPGIFGKKSTIGKRVDSFVDFHSKIHGIEKKKYTEHKPKGKALALSNKIKGK